jgi:hypothetical protein
LFEKVQFFVQSGREYVSLAKLNIGKKSREYGGVAGILKNHEGMVCFGPHLATSQAA